MLTRNKATLLLVVLLSLNTFVFSQIISLKQNNLTVLQAMELLKEKSGYSFVFESSDIDTKKIISVSVDKQSIEAVVKQILVGQPVQYEIIGRNIIVKKNAGSAPKTSITKTNGMYEFTGTVKDEKGESIIGASVKLKEPAVTVLTDINGRFRIVSATRADKPIITVSYIGFVTQVIQVTKSSNIEIVLKEDSKRLNEVVITAMGIERKAKSLTYATQTVGGTEFTRSKDANFINSLQGKSAGLIITPNTSGGAGGGSSKIILRGQSDMYGNNQPLIVLDGVPLSSGLGSQAGANMVMGGARDGGDLMSMINPDDIASMTILKGPNAAALYGSKANNGVLVITTKRGREGKLRVDVSSNTVVETPFMMPKIQSTYSGEIQGYSMLLNGWGKKISDITAEDMARIPYLTNTPVDNLAGFFQPSVNTNNSVSVNGGTENYQSYFSYGNTQATGLIENNKFGRHNILFKQGFLLLNKRLSVDVSVNYVHQNIKNQPVIGKALSPLLGLYRMPRSIDLRYFEQNYQHIAEANDALLAESETNNKKLQGLNVQSWPWFDQYVNNPYWLLNHSKTDDVKDRLLSSATLKGIITKNLNVQARLNVDQNMDRSSSSDDATLNIESRLKGGRCYASSSYKSDIYSDYLATYNNRFNDKIDLNATAGTSFSRKYNYNQGYTNYIDTAGVPNAFSPANNRKNKNESSVSTYEGWSTYWESSVFATAQLGLWDKVYLDGSYRIDWAKPFQQFAAPGKYKYFDYYSVGGNALLKEIFFRNIDAISAMKYRASYSVVGNSIPDNSYGTLNIDFWSGAISQNLRFSLPARPNMTYSFETGLDGSLFQNKLNFDLTFYNSVLKNQYRTVSTASGETRAANGGTVRNRGVELTTSYKINFTQDFRWTPGINIAFNDNKVIKMFTNSAGVEQVVQDGPSEFKYKQITGNPYGDLYVNAFQRQANGKLALNPDYSPKLDSTGNYSSYVGNATAPFTFGFTNSIYYKNFSLYMLIDGKLGGKVISLTQADLDARGLSERSAEARMKSYDKTYTYLNSDNKEVTETVQVFQLSDGQEVNTRKYFEMAGANPNELHVFDATNVRIRELSLGYTFEDFFGVSKSLTVSFVAKNIGFLYKKSPVDPDISLSAGNGFSGIDVYSLPTTRNFGLNVKATF